MSIQAPIASNPPQTPIRKAAPNKKEPIRNTITTKRNEPCYCNSGKKYKNCHWSIDKSTNLSPISQRQEDKQARKKLKKARAESNSPKEKQRINNLLSKVLIAMDEADKLLAPPTPAIKEEKPESVE